MTPRLPQQQVRIVVGKKKQSRKVLRWFCFLVIGGVFFWGAIRSLPFNIINSSKQVMIGTQSNDSSEASDAARIGVAEATIQSLFEQPDIGFTFENSSAVNGEPRMIGTSAHGLATIELIGQPADLTRATIKVSIPDDDTQALTLNAEYVLRFIQSVAPQWPGGGEWVIQNLDAFASGHRSAVNTIQAGKEISMALIGEQEFLTITVKAEQ